jgi:hypothetical protein
MCLKMKNSSTENALKSGNEKCPKDGCSGCRQQYPTKIRQKTMSYALTNIFFNTFRNKWALK